MKMYLLGSITDFPVQNDLVCLKDVRFKVVYNNTVKFK